MSNDSIASNEMLRRLAVFVGRWEWEAMVDGQPIGRGPTEFGWLEGGAFLVEHSGAESPEFPSSTTVIGCDDTAGTYVMLQTDSRSIARIYQMSFEEGVWKIWRDHPGFSQRFAGTFGDDGQTIQGSFEKSSDGATWEVDFDITYTKVVGKYLD